MTDYESVLSSAMQLPAEERMRLIDDLSMTEESNFDSPFHDDWLAEIERRVAELESGGKTIPWLDVRDAAISRLRIYH